MVLLGGISGVNRARESAVDQESDVLRLTARGPSRLTLEGGTHNPFAQPFDFLAHTFLLQLARFGPRIEATLVRSGFYPAGGGPLEIEITPPRSSNPLNCWNAAPTKAAASSRHLAALGPHIAERAFAQFEKRMGWPSTACEIIEHPPPAAPNTLPRPSPASAKKACAPNKSPML
jgi:RNA 3'-terminal phosphate cyclase (ATP)